MYYLLYAWLYVDEGVTTAETMWYMYSPLAVAPKSRARMMVTSEFTKVGPTGPSSLQYETGRGIFTLDSAVLLP